MRGSILDMFILDIHIDVRLTVRYMSNPDKDVWAEDKILRVISI